MFQQQFDAKTICQAFIKQDICSIHSQNELGGAVGVHSIELAFSPWMKPTQRGMSLHTDGLSHVECRRSW